MKRKPAPTLKEQFAQAKALIQQKRYHEARTLLRTIDHPAALEWLAKLAKIAPETPARPNPILRAARNVMVLLLVSVTIYALFSAIKNYQQTVGSAGATAAKQIAPLVVAATATMIAAAATDVPAATTITASASPTITETIVPSATITDTSVPIVIATATLDTAAQLATIDALATAGEAAIASIRKPLEQFPDFQGLRNLSAMPLSDGLSVNIDANVAPADDNDITMWRVLALVQGLGTPISQIRITTFSREQIDSLWLWEDGVWSVTRLATGNTEQYSSPPDWMATPVTGLSCPANCDEAVALGWTEQQAGQCSNLDRDGDGVACYGD